MNDFFRVEVEGGVAARNGYKFTIADFLLHILGFGEGDFGVFFTPDE